MIKQTLLVLAMTAAVTTAKAGVKEIGTINGVKIYRIRTASLFAPSSTTIVAADPNKPGVVEVLNGVGGPGFVPAVANAGGMAGGAALLRPARSNTNVEQSGANATANGNGGSATATGNGGAGGAGGNAVGGNHQNGSIHHNN